MGGIYTADNSCHSDNADRKSHDAINGHYVVLPDTQITFNETRANSFTAYTSKRGNCVCVTSSSVVSTPPKDSGIQLLYKIS